MRTFVTNVKSSVGLWSVEGTDDGVSHIHLPFDKRAASRGRAPTPVAEAAAQLEEYFAGVRRAFTVRCIPTPATDFQRDVWAELRTIPYGQVRTYGEIAQSVNRPRAHRAVGNANHANRWPVVIPCHRVVAANGLGGYGGGEQVKRFLLGIEGVNYGE
jgi:methylated-DNA-[protein]-cysteine S-methyltransferase